MGSEDIRPVSRPKVISVLKKSFGALCAPGGRYLTVDNIHRVLQPFGLTEDEDIIDLIHQAQLTDNGIICYEEFDKILKKKLEVLDEPVEDCVRNAFDLLDYDKNGYITIPELFHLFGEVGEMWTDQDLYEVVKAGDIDGDGRLDLEDFFKFLGYNLTPREEIQGDSEEVGSRWPPTIEKVQTQTAAEETEVCGRHVRSERRKSGCLPEGESIINVVREAEDAGLLQYSRRNSREKYQLVRMATAEELTLLLQRNPPISYKQRRRSNSLLPPSSVHLVPQSMRLLPRPRSSSVLLRPGGFAAFPREKATDRRPSLECNTLSSLSLVRKLEIHLKQNGDKSTQGSCPKTPGVSRRGSMAEKRRMSKDSDITAEISRDSLVKGGVVKMPSVECAEAVSGISDNPNVLQNATVNNGMQCHEESPVSDVKKNCNESGEKKRESQNGSENDDSKGQICEISNNASNAMFDDGFSAISSMTCDADQRSLDVKAGSNVGVSSGIGNHCTAYELHLYTQDEENLEPWTSTDKLHPWHTLSEASKITESLDNVLDPWGQTGVSTGSEVLQCDNHRSSTPKVAQRTSQAAVRKDLGYKSDEENDGFSGYHKVADAVDSRNILPSESQESSCGSPRVWQSPSAADSLNTPSPPATPLWGDSIASLTSMDTVDSLTSEAEVSARKSEDKRKLRTFDIEEFARRVENTIQQRLETGKKELMKTAKHSLPESPRTSEDVFYNDKDSFDQDKVSRSGQHGFKYGFSQEGHTRTIKDSSPDSGFAEQTLGSLIRNISEKLSPRNKYHTIAKERGVTGHSPEPLTECVAHRPSHTLGQRKLGVLPYRGRSSNSSEVVTHPSRLYKQSSHGKCMGIGLILPGQNQDKRRIKNEGHKGFWKSSYKVSVEKEPNLARRHKRNGARRVQPATVCRQINLTLGQTGSGNSLLRYQSLSRSIGQGRQHYVAIDKHENKKVKKQSGIIQQSVNELKIPDQACNKPVPKKLSLLSSLPSPLGHFHRRCECQSV